jgi:Polyphosphate kinase
MGLFTADTRIGVDASNIFNMLSGFSEPRRFEMLNIAPLTMRDFLGERIKDEIKAAQAGRPAKIRMKMNSLSDPRIIDQLYQASAAGVKIDIIVRGICCLKTGIKGVSDNITVHSIVGRFLEHSRIYYFYADGQERLFLSSADMMNRNLSRRVELLFPVLQADIKAQIIQIYDWMWQDNLKTRVLMADGTYQKVDRRGLDPFEVQAALMAQANAARVHEVDQAVKQERTTFEPLRKPQDKFD